MKIGVLDALTVGKDIDLTPLGACGELVIYELTAPEEVAERVKDLDIIITNKVVLGEDNLKECTHLKMIGLLATGYNNIDLDYAKAHGIAVANVAGYSTESVAQHTFAMLLHLEEHLGQYDAYVKSKQYASSDTFTYIAWPYKQLSGKTMGIIGMGAIGKAVARIATAFGMKVIYYSTSGKNNSASTYERVALQELLKMSDVVSIHAPYNHQTHHLIGYEQIACMKPTAYLLNLGRGNIVIEADLVKALNENLIAGAGLDVLEKEPITHESVLFDVIDQNKLLITPHIAWASVEARETLIQEVVQNIEAFKKQEARNRIV